MNHEASLSGQREPAAGYARARLHAFCATHTGRAFVFSALSLILCLSWGGLRTLPHPWADLSRGSFTDHFSHMNAARAFSELGLQIYRQGPMLMYPPIVGEELAKLPRDTQFGGSWTGGVYPMPGSSWDKPWVTSWSGYPRPYPPGDLLLVAPIAFLYERTDLSFAGANRLLIMLFLIYAHVGVFFGTRLVLREASLATPVLWGAWALVYLEGVHHTLEGFYDFAAAAPLFLCFDFLRARRGLAAAVAYCAAAVIHFRVLFLAPLSLYAVYIFVRDRQWQRFGVKQALAAFAVLSLSFVTLGTFWLVTPALRQMTVTNAANVWVQPLMSPGVLWLSAVVLLATAILVYARAYFDAFIALWLGVMYLSLREVQPWHSLIVATWLIAPVWHARPRAEEAVRSARLFMFSFITILFLRNPLWPNYWMPLLWAPLPVPP
jgi:hypothetical protein